MKTLFRIAFLLSAALLAAQEPFVHETAEELTTVCNLNADARADIAVIDRTTGAVRLGTHNADGSLTWVLHLTGIENVSAAAAGSLASGQTDILALTSQGWNRVDFLTPAGVITSADNIGIDMSALAPTQIGGEVLVNTPLVSASRAFSFVGNFSQSTGQRINHVAAPPLRNGNSVRTTAFQRHSLFIDEAAHEAQLWQASPEAGTPVIKTAFLTNLPIDARTAEIPVRSAIAGVDDYHLAGWTPGTSQFIMARILSTPAFGPAVSVSTPFPLGALRHIAANGTNGRDTVLLLISSDGTQAATMRLPSGSNVLEAVQTFSPPAGSSFTGALVQANGGFHFLSGTGGRTATAQWMAWNGSMHSAGVSSLLPSMAGNRVFANVYVFSGEPWVDPAAVFSKSFKIRDWSITAVNNAGTLTVTALADAGSFAGLGASASQTASGATPGHFSLPNQIRGNVSLASLGTAIGTPRPSLSFSPPPGTYRPLIAPGGEPFGLAVKIENPSGLTGIAYRINGGAWNGYDPASPPIMTASGRLEAFGTIGAIPSNETVSPTITGDYQLGGTGALLAASPSDSNANGLSDAWEKTFGLNDATGDPDADGFTNLQEQSAGTDPQNPSSHPATGGELPLIQIAHTTVPGGGLVVFWTTTEAGLILQTSTNLQNDWSNIPSSSLTVSGTSFPFPVPAAHLIQRRFYKLHRP